MPPRRKDNSIDRSKLDATPPWDLKTREPTPPTTGPFDLADAPPDTLGRVDLGALKVPVDNHLELRLEVNPAQQVVAVVIAGPHGHMQLGVFAAPRTEGIWDEVRAEIRGSLASQGGQPAERDGDWGPELSGILATERAKVPVRFVGIDGPRWFLRAMFVGAVATDRSKAAPLEAVLRNVVVDRGVEPLPVREPVPLQMPRNSEIPDTLTEDDDIDSFGGEI